jgi:hypothetical protein
MADGPAYTPENTPLTDGAERVMQRDYEAQKAAEKRAEERGKEVRKAEKENLTDEDRKAGKAHQDLSSVNPLAARAMGEGVLIDQMSRRSAKDPMYGHFLRVVSGPHEGVYGVYVGNAHVDEDTGYPTTIQVRTRDDDHALILVDVDDAELAVAGGR